MSYKEIVSKLKELKTLNSQKEFLLKALGQNTTKGSTRLVWVLGDAVIKLARYPEASSQNENEVDVHQCLGSSYFAKVLDYDHENYNWLIMEKVNTNYEKKREILSRLFPKFRPTDDDIVEWFANNVSGKEFTILFENTKEQEVAEWLLGLKNTIQKCSISTDDLHSGNFGIRNSTNLPVFFDYADYNLLEEQNSLGAGNVVGYTAPLGAPGIGSSNKLEKGFWRDKAGKKVKTGSPELDKDIKEMVQAIDTPQGELNMIKGLWQGKDKEKVKTKSQELSESNISLLNLLWKNKLNS